MIPVARQLWGPEWLPEAEVGWSTFPSTLLGTTGSLEQRASTVVCSGWPCLLQELMTRLGWARFLVNSV